MTRKQIITYMIDVLGYSEDELTDSTNNLWNYLTTKQQEECKQFNS